MDNQIENWKQIENYPEYFISTLGRVWSNKSNKILSQTKPLNGYLQVSLSENKISTSKCIHHLMAKTYLGKRPKRFEINHIDGNKENNKLSNLEYIPWYWNRNRKYPIRYCIVCGRPLMGKSHSQKTCSKECHIKKYFVNLKCKYCGKSFFRRRSIHRIRVKYYPGEGENNFCSRKCFGKKIGRNNGSKRRTFIL